MQNKHTTALRLSLLRHFRTNTFVKMSSKPYGESIIYFWVKAKPSSLFSVYKKLKSIYQTNWRRRSIIHSSANVTVEKNSLCQKRAWVEDWKKILFQQTKTNSITHIFFQSSTLGQKDNEISRLIRTKKIICRIVEW